MTSKAVLLVFLLLFRFLQMLRRILFHYSGRFEASWVLQPGTAPTLSPLCGILAANIIQY